MSGTVAATVNFVWNNGTLTGLSLPHPVAPPGPTPPPLIPSDPTGIRARRIAELVDLLGFNLYCNLPGETPLGASPYYTRANVEAVMRWLLGSSGAAPNFRCWYFGNRLADYQAWDVAGFLKTIGGAWASIAIGNAGGAADVNMGPLLQSGWRVENVNEPNGNPGQNPSAVLQAAAAIRLMLPTAPARVTAVAAPMGIFMGGPTSADYCLYYDGTATPGPNTQHAGAVADEISLHDYPPFNPDFLWSGTNKPWLQELHDGANAAYGSHPLYESEYHPTQYNQQGHVHEWDYDCYYLALAPLQRLRLGMGAFQWWSLFDDYGLAAGMFVSGTADARPAAHVARALYQLMPDAGAGRRSFAPGNLDVTFSGLQPPNSAAEPNTGGHLEVFQASDGTFYVLVWNSQQDPRGAAAQITASFRYGPMTSVKRYVLSSNVAAGPDPISLTQSWSGASSVTFPLGAEVQLLVIGHP